MEIVQLKDIELSVLRWLIGLTIGCLLGLLFAILGSFKITNKPSKIINDFFRAIPIIGLVPVVQMNIGINEFGKIGLVAWAVMFPVWITVRSALNQKMESSELMLKSANISNITYFKLFTFPKLFSGFLKGVEIAIGIAWLAVVAGEWVGTYTQGFWSGGLGYKLIVGYELNNWDIVHYNLLIFGVLGFLSAYLWRFLTKIIFENSKTFNPIIREL
jgi:sulfonate transport system permease protein